MVPKITLPSYREETSIQQVVNWMRVMAEVDWQSESRLEPAFRSELEVLAWRMCSCMYKWKFSCQETAPRSLLLYLGRFLLSSVEPWKLLR